MTFSNGLPRNSLTKLTIFPFFLPHLVFIIVLPFIVFRFLSILYPQNRCIIVDSTRKGKRVPDALSKTIPIWCATINNAVRKRALLDQQQRNQEQQNDQEPQQGEDQGSITLVSNADDSLKDTDTSYAGDAVETASSLLVPALDSNNWDTRYHSLPSLISRSEHAQIAEKIDGFAEKLMVKSCSSCSFVRKSPY